MYTKLYQSITTSSLWSEDSDTCKVWVTLMALMDREGFVFGTAGGLARIAALPVDVVARAMVRFESPDPDSSDMKRAPEREGRRLERVDGGWRLLNATHYRDLRDADERRFNERQKKRRQRSVPSCPPLSPSVPPSEVDTDSKKNISVRFKPPTVEEVRGRLIERGLTGVIDPELFVAHYAARGWKYGGGVRMKSWDDALTTWKKNAAAPTTVPPKPREIDSSKPKDFNFEKAVADREARKR